MKSLIEIIECRLSVQGLTHQKYERVEAIIKDSLAVQAQDLTLSRYSFGLRTGYDDNKIKQSLKNKNIIRTHILRPTWHWVLAEDLRWLIDLTGENIISRHKSFQNKLGIDEKTISESFLVLKNLLDQTSLTRNEIAKYLPKTNYISQSQVVGHILIMAEARGLICSGEPNEKDEHTYALLDQVVPLEEKMDRQEAINHLVYRFLKGRGVITLRDLTRWVYLSKTELSRALTNNNFKSFKLEGVDHWYINKESHGINGSWLIPTFDEALLSHDQLHIPFIEKHPLMTQKVRLTEKGSGRIIVNGLDIGVFKRRFNKNGSLEIELFLSPNVSRYQKDQVLIATNKLGYYLGQSPIVICDEIGTYL